MTALTLAVMLQASILSAEGHTYAEAHKLASTEGRPLMVLVGADWCPACRTMKQSVMPQAERQGLLDRVAFAHVNTDHEPGIARSLMQGGAIPQLIVYRQTADGWRRTRLVGAQSISTIEALVDRALEEAPAQLSQTSQAK